MSQTYRIGSLNFTGSQAVLSASLDVSGSGSFTNGLTVTGSITAFVGSITAINGGINFGSSGQQRMEGAAGVGNWTFRNSVFEWLQNGETAMILNNRNNLLVGTTQSGSNYRVEIGRSPGSGSLKVDTTFYVTGSQIGVNNSLPQNTLDVSGSGRFSNNLTVSGSGNILTIANSSGTTLFRVADTGIAETLGASSGNYSLVVNSNAASGGSFGLSVVAGTNTSDAAIRVRNKANTADLLVVRGDGTTFTNNLTATGSLTVAGGDLSVITGSANYLRVFPSTGNVFIGSTPVDGGFKLDVNGTTRIQNTLTVSAGGANIVGNTTITGSFGVQGSVAITNFLTASTALLSGSGDSRLRVLGSGSNNPIMSVGGSSGQLFTVTDSLSGAIFTVNNLSALPILSVNSDDTVKIGASNAMGLYSSYRVVTTTANTEIYKVLTASYDALYVDYSIKSGSNARAGQLVSIWSGSQVNYTELSASQFGDTSGFTFAAYISQSYMNVSSSATTNGWDVKTIIRSI